MQGGMCWEEDRDDAADADDADAGGDGDGDGGGDGGGGGEGESVESVESVEECCARAYRAPHVQASFSVWRGRLFTRLFVCDRLIIEYPVHN